MTTAVVGAATARAKSAMQGLYEAGTAAYRRQIIAATPFQPDGMLLDVGCDDGAWTDAVRRAAGIAPERVAGIEAVEERAELARARGFEVRIADIEQRWPYDDGRFDVVHANQVIEHVKRLDHFVLELRRVLRPGGAAVLCTENLASWHNVAALMLGYMPFSLTNISATGPIGNPFALHAGETPSQETWQHIHVVTTTGLRAIMEAHGFRVERVFAAGYYPAFGRLAPRMAAIDPRHAHFIGVLARRGGSAAPPR